MASGIFVVILLYFCLLIGLKQVAPLKYCYKVGKCKCRTDEGIIDLRKVGSRDGHARFPNIGSHDMMFAKFSWNPCYPYSTGECQNVAACAETIGKEQYSIASPNDFKCKLNKEDGRCNLVYRGSIRWKTTSLNISLACAEMPDTVNSMLVLYPSEEAFEFKTVLHTKHACLNKSPTSTYKPHTAHSIQPTIAPSDSSSVNIPDENPGLSLGSKLLIAFFSLLLAYAIIGTLFNKYVRHKEGKEVFPNYEFWIDLPVLVKDGGTFTVHSFRRLCVRGSKGGFTMI